MVNKKTLTIVSGEEFKIYIRDKIESTDIFYDQYRKAAGMLDEILGSHNKIVEENGKLSEPWNYIDYENNIIAICGERGEGKSSVMMSFIKAVCNHDANPIFKDFPNIKSTYFSKPIVIDPSMFDDVHNVLDIILATLYKEFREKYERNYESVEKRDREELLNQFQKVYRYISLINNQSKMLDDEFDYEGNIGKLSKLGESTNIKREFRKLVKLYLRFMAKGQESQERLLIAIDDLDLCSSHAYNMAEQIRKYLIIPNVVIIMALKMDQMQLCIQEQTYMNYKNSLGMKNNNVYDEVNGMAERYMAKLIPNARRIYMTNILKMPNVEIEYKNSTGNNIFAGLEKNTTGENLLKLIYKTTGMKFLPDEFGENFLLPENLRDIVSLVNILGTLEKIDENYKIDEKYNNYRSNILRFSDYYEQIWVKKNLVGDKDIEKLIRRGYAQLNKNVICTLKRIYSDKGRKLDLRKKVFEPTSEYSFSEGISWLSYLEDNSSTDEERMYAYAIRILYTIRMNELYRRGKYGEIARLLNGYVWADDFSKMIPNIQGIDMSRARFQMSIVKAFKVISKELHKEMNCPFVKTSKDQYYITKMSGQGRTDQVRVWIIAGMLMNTYEKIFQRDQLSSKQFIASNNVILSDTHVSLENYIVSLCDLDSLYEKINLEQLGIGRSEFENFIERLEKYNKVKIDVFRKIIFNTDVTMKFKEYCIKNKRLKEGFLKEEDRTRGVIDLFFKNIVKFMQEMFDEYDKLLVEELANFQLGENESVDIIELYSTFVMKKIELEEAEEVSIEKRELQEFIAILENKFTFASTSLRVSSYLKNKSAENAKENLRNLANNIQKYYTTHQEENLDKESKQELYDIYAEISRIYAENPKIEISKVLQQKYKEIVNKYNYVNE